jgi:hypothetical protein
MYPVPSLPAETPFDTRDRDTFAGTTTKRTQLAVDATAPERIDVPQRSSRQQNKAQTSAVNVNYMESNGSLRTTNNTRISLYGSVYVFYHTSRARDVQQRRILCMHYLMRDFLHLYKAFYRKL